MKTNKNNKSGGFKAIHKFVENLEKQRSCIKQNLMENFLQAKKSEVYEMDSKKIKLSDFSKDERIINRPTLTITTNKETGHYDRLLNFIESLKEDSMPNEKLQSLNESIKNSTDVIEKDFESALNNQTIKKYFQVAKDTKFQKCSFKKSITQQKIRPNLKPSFSNKENIEKSHFLSYRDNNINTNSIFENIQVASKMKVNKNESITNSLNIIEKSSKQEDMEVSVLDLSKRSSIYNFVEELDQDYKTECTIKKQKDTFTMEDHNAKDLWRKISIDEFTNRVLEETNTDSKSAKDILSNSVSLKNPIVTVNTKLYKPKASNEKCSNDIPIFSNLSLEYNRNDKGKQFHSDNCMKEFTDFSNIPSKIVTNNFSQIDHSTHQIVKKLKINEGNYLKKSSKNSILHLKKADFFSTQVEHNKQVVRLNRMTDNTQHFKLEPVETNELRVKSKSGGEAISKLEEFETDFLKTSPGLITHNKTELNYYSRHKSKENNCFDYLKENSKSGERLVSRDIHSDNNTSIPFKNPFQLTESSNIECINSNNVYLSDILSKENNLLGVGKKIEIYASQDATKSTITDNQNNLNSSHNDYSAQTDNSITENQTNLNSSHNNCIAQTDRSPNYSKSSALLDDKLLKSMLIKNYERYKQKPQKECRNLKDVFTELTQDFQIDMMTNKINSNKCHIERFRKGKVKIYRLKKLKKGNSVKKEPQDVNLSFDELFQRITQHFVEPKNSSADLDSCYSVSTPSSYISDDARSETLSTGSKNLNSPDRRLRQGLNELSKDQNLLYYDNQYEETTDYSKDEIKMRIRDIFLQVFDDLTNGRRCFLRYRRQCYENCEFRNDRLQFKPNEWVTMSEISSTSKRSEAKFKLIMFILEKILTLLETNTKLTKREIYYQFKNMIKNQSVTDRAINSISCLLGVGMWSLNIMAQKGLVFGNLRILMSSGETLNCNIPGTLIPQDIADISEIQSTAYFILVVEKEAIFHKLIEEDLPNKLTRPFIMVTGKGFPDLNTQLFLKKLWMIMSIPVFILVDADPHGINIMLNYRFGSVANAHVSYHLAVPRAKWLGVYPSEIVNFNIARQPMTEKELKLVAHLLKTPYMDQYPRIAEELKVLQERNFKAGIEGLIKSDIFLSQVYLPMKFSSHNFI